MMSSAEAIFASMNIEEPHIIIGSDRVINVPKELRRIAVQYDHNIETVTFDCPRYWDEHDMSTMNIYINYMRSDGKPGSYVADNVRVNETDSTLMHFDWTISRNVSEVKGKLAVLVCIKNIDDTGNEKTHWNSELNKDMYISEGMDCCDVIVNLHPDVITQILTEINTGENKLTEALADLEKGTIKTVENVKLWELDTGIYYVSGDYSDNPSSVYNLGDEKHIFVIYKMRTDYVKYIHFCGNIYGTKWMPIDCGISSGVVGKSTEYKLTDTSMLVDIIDKNSTDNKFPSARSVYIFGDNIKKELQDEINTLKTELQGDIEALKTEIQGNLDEIGDLIGGEDSGAGENITLIETAEYEFEDSDGLGFMMLPIDSIPDDIENKEFEFVFNETTTKVKLQYSDYLGIYYSGTLSAVGEIDPEPTDATYMIALGVEDGISAVGVYTLEGAGTYTVGLSYKAVTE